MSIGEGITKESLNLIFLLDTSLSMSGARIGQLNHAIPEALQELKKVAIDEETDAFVRIIRFNSNPNWYMGNATQGVNINDAPAQWKNLTVEGGTDTAAAIRLCLSALHTKNLGTRNYLPVVVLVTDGESNIPAETMKATEELKKALTGGRGKEKVQRIAVGVQDYNEAELNSFASLGTIDYGNGNVVENTPLVFKVDDVNDLSAVLKNIAVSSLYSSANGGNDDDGGLIIDRSDDKDIWVS